MLSLRIWVFYNKKLHSMYQEVCVSMCICNAYFSWSWLSHCYIVFLQAVDKEASWYQRLHWVSKDSNNQNHTIFCDFNLSIIQILNNFTSCKKCKLLKGIIIFLCMRRTHQYNTNFVRFLIIPHLSCFLVFSVFIGLKNGNGDKMINTWTFMY